MEGAETCLHSPLLENSPGSAGTSLCHLYGSCGGCLLQSRADDAGLPSTRFNPGCVCAGGLKVERIGRLQDT